MKNLSFVPLGVGDAFTALHYSSSLWVEYDGEGLLIDCPHPIQKMLREARLSSGLPLAGERLVALALTHLHADHASGVEGLAYFHHFALKKKLSLAAHPDVVSRLWDGHLAAGMERLLPRVGAPVERRSFGDYFARSELSEQGPVHVGPFAIECRRTIHHVPTTALRITAGGRTLGYSADAAFDEGLIAWLAEADLFVHETNFGVHTPYEKLAALPSELRARMRLIHYPDSFDLTDSVIEPLVEGRVYGV